jgi:hypothetical protein
MAIDMISYSFYWFLLIESRRAKAPTQQLPRDTLRVDRQGRSWWSWAGRSTKMGTSSTKHGQNGGFNKVNMV